MRWLKDSSGFFKFVLCLVGTLVIIMLIYELVSVDPVRKNNSTTVSNSTNVVSFKGTSTCDFAGCYCTVPQSKIITKCAECNHMGYNHHN